MIEKKKEYSNITRYLPRQATVTWNDWINLIQIYNKDVGGSLYNIYDFT